jgi:hypothetical protein
VRGADGDRQRIALGLLHEVGSLGHVGQQLFAGHGAFRAVAVFLVALHGFQGTQHAQFRFHGHADGVRELHHFARHLDVVLVGSDGLAVSHQRAVHHHRREAGLDGGHADCRRLAVVLVHDDRDVRVGFDRRVDQVAQESFASVFTGAGGGLHDDRRVDRVGRGHDGLHLFQVVDVESRDAVAVFSGVVQQLAHGYDGHGSTPNNKKSLAFIVPSRRGE